MRLLGAAQNEMEAMRNSGRKTQTLPTFWKVSDGPNGLAAAVKKLQADAEAAVKAGEMSSPLCPPSGR